MLKRIALVKDEQWWQAGTMSGNLGGLAQINAVTDDLERKTKFEFNSNFNNQNSNLRKKRM